MTRDSRFVRPCITLSALSCRFIRGCGINLGGSIDLLVGSYVARWLMLNRLSAFPKTQRPRIAVHIAKL